MKCELETLERELATFCPRAVERFAVDDSYCRYLLSRVKLRLLMPDLSPMTVFDAYNALIRQAEDSELYSIYEYLMDSGAIVVPFRHLKREATYKIDRECYFTPVK